MGKRKGRGRGSPHVASRLSSLSHGQAFKFPTLFARPFRWGSDVGVCPPLLLTLALPSPNSPKWKPPPQRQPVPRGVHLRSRATSELAIAPVSPMNGDSGHEGAPLFNTRRDGEIRTNSPRNTRFRGTQRTQIEPRGVRGSPRQRQRQPLTPKRYISSAISVKKGIT